MKIKVLTYHEGFVECDIPDDFTFLRVTMMTGDEIIEVYRDDEEWGDTYLCETIDPDYENRTRDFFDCTYIVRYDQVEEWNNRTPNYNYFGREEFKKSVMNFSRDYDIENEEL